MSLRVVRRDYRITVASPGPQGPGGGGGGSSDHATLSNLAWTLSGHTGAIDHLAGFDSAGDAEEIPISTLGRALVALATSADGRAALDLVIGTHVQAWDADLDALAALSGTGIARRTGSNTWSVGSLVTLAEMATIATQRLIGRDTAGTGVPESVTISAALDWIGSTRGSVLYRGASGWAALVPGTAGYPLVSGGSGADDSYARLGLAGIVDLAGLSVLGRSANSSGVLAAITAATVGHALQLADDGASLGWREPSFATRTLAGAVRSGRFPEESGTPRFWPVGIASATTSTTQASVANRCIFVPEVWQWTSNQRWDALTAEVTTPSAAGTKFRLMLYAEGSDGMAASLIWTSADLAADAGTEVVALLSLGTWQNTAYKDSNGYFYAPPGTNFYTAIHTETTTTFRAVAASACKVISQSSGTLTSNNLMYVSGTFASGAPSSGAGPTMANGNRHIVRLRGVP